MPPGDVRGRGFAVTRLHDQADAADTAAAEVAAAAIDDVETSR